jgi:hypothetical protein
MRGTQLVVPAVFRFVSVTPQKDRFRQRRDPSSVRPSKEKDRFDSLSRAVAALSMAPLLAAFPWLH